MHIAGTDDSPPAPQLLLYCCCLERVLSILHKFTDGQGDGPEKTAEQYSQENNTPPTILGTTRLVDSLLRLTCREVPVRSNNVSAKRFCAVREGNY